MATQDDTKPCDALALLCGRYESLCELLRDHLGHGSHVLPLFDGLNDEFRRVLDDLSDRGMLS